LFSGHFSASGTGRQEAFGRAASGDEADVLEFFRYGAPVERLGRDFVGAGAEAAAMCCASLPTPTSGSPLEFFRRTTNKEKPRLAAGFFFGSNPIHAANSIGPV
jgi:hypothetical protein